MKSGSIVRVVATSAAVVLLAACSPSATPSPSAVPASPSGTATGTAAGDSAQPSPAGTLDPATGATTVVATGLFVLGDAIQGGMGLWTYDSKLGWVSRQAIPGGTAIAPAPGGIAVANGNALETRTAGDPATVASSATLTWPGQAPASGLAALSVSSSGRIALAISERGTVSYATSDATGQVRDMAVAATQPFTPLIAWLDDDRKLILSTDKQQVSRLAVGTGRGSFADITGLTGCRWFAVSSDGGAIAAGTDSALYVASTSSWLAGKTPPQVAAVKEGFTAWDLALDRSGTRLAFLTGAVAADGTVGSMHEVVYVNSSGSWQKALDVTAPFSRARGQAWAG